MAAAKSGVIANLQACAAREMDLTSALENERARPIVEEVFGSPDPAVAEHEKRNVPDWPNSGLGRIRDPYQSSIHRYACSLEWVSLDPVAM